MIATEPTELLISEIEVGHRHRKVKNIDLLKQSMTMVGLLNPITVVRIGDTYKLVAGAHRLEAAKELGWERVTVSVRELDEVHAEMTEIDENLSQRGLTALEQGEHLLRRDELLMQIGRRARGDTPRTPRTPEEMTTAEIADEVGLTERTAQYRKQAAKGLAQDVRDAIRDTHVADRTMDLLALSRMSADEQRHVVQRMAEGARSVAAALRPVRTAEEEDEYDDDDVPERLNPVVTTIKVAYRIPNPRMRTRGDKMVPREDVRCERTVTVNDTAEVLTDEASLLALCKKVGAAMFNELRAQGWPVPEKMRG